MQGSRLINTATRCIIRQLCISSVAHKSYSVRESRILNKLMQSQQPKRKRNKTNSHVITSGFSESPKKALSVYTVRRMAVLSKIFMEHITDLLATGQVAPELIDIPIEISHIKVSPDFKNISVFWIEDDSHSGINVEEILQKSSKQIRHELSQLHVIGLVPPIAFVKSKHIALQKEVERRLEIADYGEDYKAQSAPYNINESITYADKPDLDESENQEEQDTRNVDPPFSISLPVMRHDVLGLDHHAMMTKIKVQLEKSRTSTKRRAVLNESNMNVSTEWTPINLPENVMSKQEEEEQFIQFLTKRRVEERHKHRRRNLKRNDEDIVNLEVAPEYDHFPSNDDEYDIDYERDNYVDYDEDK